MGDGRHIVVAEIGLTKNRYGAEIRTSEPMSLEEAREFALNAVRGDHPDFYRRPENAVALRVGADDQYLVVEGHRLSPDSLSRLTVADVLDAV
ncbi:hypothetical protein [Streptomyces sp. XY332]|uniref:hypothetical protein n=1 Tax=Streptomyces sp. XY332 TaxID=1415561 RepID=UPI0006B16555|nr:hypothetical protein [Streptomyces sp. XY332]KOY56053.1 hypothetical protein ADK59_21265 [Streptomyces sp. XY332]